MDEERQLEVENLTSELEFARKQLQAEIDASHSKLNEKDKTIKELRG